MRSLCPGKQMGSVRRALTPSHSPQTPAWGSRTQQPPPQSGSGFCSVRSPPLKYRQKGQQEPHFPAATHCGPTSRPCNHKGGGRGSERGCPHPRVGANGTLTPRTMGGGGKEPFPSPAPQLLSQHAQAHSGHAPAPNSRVLSGSTAHIQLFRSGWKGRSLWFIP